MINSWILACKSTTKAIGPDIAFVPSEPTKSWIFQVPFPFLTMGNQYRRLIRPGVGLYKASGARR